MAYAAINFNEVPELPPISKPATHAELVRLADAAYAQFIALGGKVTVLPRGPKN